jgi:hypothetical protein
VGWRTWWVIATKIIRAANPKELSIKVAKIGTRGRRARGNTTFLTKFAWLITELAAWVTPPAKANQGKKPAKSQSPKVRVLSEGKPVRVNLTCKTIEKT